MARTKITQVLILMGAVMVFMAAGVYGQKGGRGGGGGVLEEDNGDGRRFEVVGGGATGGEANEGRFIGGESEDGEIGRVGAGGDKEGRAITGGGGGGGGPNILLSTYSSSFVPPDCLLPPKNGNCRAYIPSFYYNPSIGACDCFVFGGCRGNANRFQTLTECMEKCGVQQLPQQHTPQCIRIFRGQLPEGLSAPTNSRKVVLSEGVTQDSQQGIQQP